MILDTYNQFILHKWLPKIVFDLLDMENTGEIDDSYDSLFFIAKQIQFHIKKYNDIQYLTLTNSNDDRQILSFLKKISWENNLMLCKIPAAFIWDFIPSKCTFEGPTLIKLGET